MAHEHLETRELYDGQVAEIVFASQPGNIITMRLIDKLSGALGSLGGSGDENKRRKLIILCGKGSHFSYGTSIEEHRVETVRDMLPRFHSLIGQVLSCKVPTLAKVTGFCLGGGFELALACSLIFCARDTKFGLPEIRLGVFPPVASILLASKTGATAARRMILTGETYTAKELQDLGIVNAVAEPAALDSKVSEFTRQHILDKSASSLRLACEALGVELKRTYDTHIKALENLYLEKLMSTQDANEGIEAFLKKRAPNWTDG